MERGRSPLDPEMNFPQDFRCPISMELMNEPVITSTGVTYERKNIQKWFITYNKTTCPATMQTLENLSLTPNHTLKRLIHAWIHSHSPSPPSSSSPPPSPSSMHLLKQDEMASILKTLESTPFKVSSLRKLGYILQIGDDNTKHDFILVGGLDVLLQIVIRILDDISDFEAFRACEEALEVIQQVLTPQQDYKIIEKLSNPKCMKSMVMVLQRGSTQSRLHTVSVFQKLAKSNFNWNMIVKHLDVCFFKSLLEFISDEINTKGSCLVLEIMIKILDSSKRSRLKAVEAGAVCTMIELLPDHSNRSKCEKILQIIKLLCECADGRLEFIKHRLGIGALSKKMLNVSETSSKICVKILWLICRFHPTDNILEEMMIYGAVKKLMILLHMSGTSSTKDKATEILKKHGVSWRCHPCFPSEIKDCSSKMLHVQHEHVNT